MYKFEVERPRTIADAVVALAANEDSKLLAGGHSLIPMMKLRFASPAMLVDLSGIEGLEKIDVAADMVTIGAMTRHCAIADSPDLCASLPVLAEVAGRIGDPHVRNSGTIGGSLATNDPNADYPAALVALGATIITTKREIAADDFFLGLFETALESDEIILRVSIPFPNRAGYSKLKQSASGFALVGVFVAQRAAGTRVAVIGAGSEGVFRAAAFEAALTMRFDPDSLEGVILPHAGLNSDIHASAELRAHLAGVLTRRAVRAANARA